MKYRKSLLVILAAFIITAAVVAGDRLSPGPGEAQLLNDRSQQIVGADMVNAPGFITPAGLTGGGQVVAVADSGLDRGSMEDIHPDLAGEPGKKPKIIMLKSWSGRQLADDPEGHGTHMVGTIAGNGSASGGKFRGVAPEANIYFQGILDANGKISPPSDLQSLFQPAYLAGARIHVNAWGSGANGYSGSAMKADAFIRSHPDFLVIFGAGNSGPGTKALTSEANSKNSLTVGSSVSPRPALDFSPGGPLDTAGFSSRGPAGDGRIKPDLLAPGTSIISTRSSLVKGNLPGYPLYSRMQGSSMASAVAAGSAALLREFMQKEMSIPEPGASSIKAALINGARTTEEGPSAEGFGVLDLGGTVLALKEKSMVLVEENRGILEGAVQKYKFRAERSGSPLKVTLAWTDPAGDLSSQKALVNNLDLSVTSPDGKIHRGNGFLGQSPDDLNNVEQVYIKEPLPGEYVIEVRGASVKAIAAKNASVTAQDYSLVYGQPLATGIIKETTPEGNLDLFGERKVSLPGKNVHSIFNGDAAEGLKPRPGYRVYYSGRSVYVAARLWEPESVRYREGIGGRIWFESDQDTREGGYYQAPEAGKGVTVNGTYLDDITGLPPGVGLEAVLDGLTQTISHLATSFIAEKGNVARVEQDKNGEVTSMELFADSRDYRVSPSTSYIYNDTFEKTDSLEVVFGSGNLNGLRKIMAGQQVTLVMPPVFGKVSSVLVSRSIISGYVTGVNLRENRIAIGQNPAFHVIAGSGVNKDRMASSLKNIAPGDYVVAVILPGTSEILGLAAYSNVVYGQVLFSSSRDSSIYVNDLQNHFQMYSISPGTEVRRWGLITDASTLSSGTWVRVTLSPDGSDVWRMDVAELLEDEQKEVAAVYGHDIFTSGGEVCSISSAFTAITKEGLPVTAEDLMPGEKITVVSLLAPAPYNKVPVAVRARSGEGAVKPAFMAAIIEESGRFMLSGYTSGDRVYIWHENGSMEDVSVPAGGSFRYPLVFKEKENSVRVVTVDRKNGAVAGKTIRPSEDVGREFTDIAGHWAGGLILATAVGGIMAGYGDGTFRPDKPITISELVALRGILTGYRPQVTPEYPWGSNQLITRASFMASIKNFFRKAAPVPDNYKFPFADCVEVTKEEKEAIAWGRYKGIIKGKTPDTFDPKAPLTRAEAAAVIQGLLHNP